MKTSMKKAGVLAAATALTASLAFLGSTMVASAAPVTVEVDADYVLPGGVAQLTIAGCSVGATLTITGGVEDETITVAEGTLPMVTPLPYEELAPGSTVSYSATCTPAEGSAEAETTASDSTYVFGSWIDAVPPEFYAGEPVTITAGDFEPGVSVGLELYPEDGTELLFSAPLGVAGADYSASADVTFPAELECGTYDLDVVGGEQLVLAQLYICGEPTPTPTPSPTPSETVTPSASPTVTASATATATPSATASATTSAPRPAAGPGLPATGV